MARSPRGRRNLCSLSSGRIDPVTVTQLLDYSNRVLYRKGGTGQTEQTDISILADDTNLLILATQNGA